MSDHSYMCHGAVGEFTHGASSCMHMNIPYCRVPKKRNKKKISQKRTIVERQKAAIQLQNRCNTHSSWDRWIIDLFNSQLYKHSVLQQTADGNSPAVLVLVFVSKEFAGNSVLVDRLTCPQATPQARQCLIVVWIGWLCPTARLVQQDWTRTGIRGSTQVRTSQARLDSGTRVRQHSHTVLTGYDSPS